MRCDAVLLKPITSIFRMVSCIVDRLPSYTAPHICQRTAKAVVVRVNSANNFVINLELTWPAD